MSDNDSGKWLEAMKSEMDSMSSNQVLTLVDRPKSVRPVECKWIYKRKIGANGEVTTFKARLVAKGYTQRPGVDFEETFLPVAMAKSIRIMLAIAIYMDQPEGFTVVGKEQKICHFQRSIYGLKQASRSWNIRFDEVIRGYDFIKNNFHPCVYKNVSGSFVVFLALYVDDILLIGNDIKILGDTKAWLSTQFSMKDLDEASYILGIKIFRDRSQRILGMTQTPIGSIQYVAQCTRSNIAYALSVTNRYQACAGEAHRTVVKTILKYLRMTKDVFLVYGGGELILEGFSDVSFQSDDDDAKSQSRFVFKLNGGVVAWKSSKQDTTANFTMKAEYIAASEAAMEAVWMKNYI
ncbi:UNVERIFIED_CONTAM: Retrovirus-related Pol polyprotein from transposon RE1 [Sesamum radiatum]|uniref:Retrovirus-related Pol polyprotein from transposon RE1 n=1 Tax=Sesamum radiatum TaxID=300843 RepID=A0AAW2UQA7_SESRA